MLVNCTGGPGRDFEELSLGGGSGSGARSGGDRQECGASAVASQGKARQPEVGACIDTYAGTVQQIVFTTCLRSYSISISIRAST